VFRNDIEASFDIPVVIDIKRVSLAFNEIPNVKAIVRASFNRKG
jgi:hypothetical protein